MLNIFRTFEKDVVFLNINIVNNQNEVLLTKSWMDFQPL